MMVSYIELYAYLCLKIVLHLETELSEGIKTEACLCCSQVVSSCPPSTYPQKQTEKWETWMNTSILFQDLGGQ